jgi:hypothetical protein
MQKPWRNELGSEDGGGSGALPARKLEALSVREDDQSARELRALRAGV